MIDLLERVALRFEREESPQQKLSKLEGFLVQYGLPLAETVPLLATLLSLPLTADYAPMAMEPAQQKQKLLEAIEDNDDTKSVWSNFDIEEKEIEASLA
jgi:hypothetical protein